MLDSMNVDISFLCAISFLSLAAIDNYLINQADSAKDNQVLVPKLQMLETGTE